jgi:alanyl-tRNA synthetase
LTSRLSLPQSRFARDEWIGFESFALNVTSVEDAVQPKSAKDIREAFLAYFADQGHQRIKSYALIPPDDPTLYFVNAGMVQFKDIFVGARQVDYNRATSCQKCLRVSGKHNDLENVGRTARHHTLFEMLGNFSFGDYFKEEAIRFGWEFLTEKLGLPVDKMWVTVHPDDDEAAAIWRDKMGLDPDRIRRDPDNFWSMGDTGPCGPCSELYIDLGAEVSGGAHVEFGTEEGDARYVELWNLVFMQYDRAADGTMTPLPKPSIDTGMGLERITAVLQGKNNNFDTDLFTPIIERVAQRAGVQYHEDEERDVALRVIADHSRAAAFLIADGIYPDNDGRGYVLRRVMRRAIRFGRLLGLNDPFLVDSTAHVVELMGDAYPELVEGKETIARIVLEEETRFGRTIQAGTKRLDEELAQLTAKGQVVLDGRVAFELYDTHGFPPDLTALICRERGMSMDQEGFEAGMQEQRERARAASRFGTGDLSAYQALVESGLSTVFKGYAQDTAQGSVQALLVDGQRVPMAAAGQRVELVVAETPFYAESGGQAGDIGVIETDAGVAIDVEDTQRPYGELVVHVGVVRGGSIKEGDAVRLTIDSAARDSTRRNHSATHLLHYALREVLGPHVRQRGSLVGPSRLRFDFSHSSGLEPAEVVAIETLVNRLILSNEPVETEIMAYDDAIESGAIAFFEEKYTDAVRVLRVGPESTELCGGTHVSATGDIGLFKLVSEEAISSGVRRVEAVVGMQAVQWVQERDRIVRAAADAVHAGPDQLLARIDKLVEERKGLQRSLDEAKLKARSVEAAASLADAQVVGEHRLAAIRFDDVAGKELRGLGESLRDRLGSGAVLLIATDGPKVSLLVAATQDVTDRLHAGKLVGALAPLVGGRGGGRPEMAQAGGSDATALADVMQRFYDLAASQLA